MGVIIPVFALAILPSLAKAARDGGESGDDGSGSAYKDDVIQEYTKPLTH